MLEVKILVTKKLLITYYSETGNTERMAKEIAQGAKSLDIRVMLKKIESCRLDDLTEVDGIVVGSPTYFSNVSWQVKKLIDESIVLYRENHKLKGKVGGCFTSAGDVVMVKNALECLNEYLVYIINYR
jgi:NAD(P)H dehydrogenase (quinone)